MSEGQMYDAPNQQAVRPDGSAPWDEGEGGSTGNAPEPQAERREARDDDEQGEEPSQSSGSDLDAMTKDQLLEHAQSIGAKPANAAMTKDDLRASIDRKTAEG